jgi:hypothetical protein
MLELHRLRSQLGELATHLRYVEDASRRVARSILEGVGRWEAKLQQKQSLLGRIVDIGTELFAIAAARKCSPVATGGWRTGSLTHRVTVR